MSLLTRKLVRNTKLQFELCAILYDKPTPNVDFDRHVAVDQWSPGWWNTITSGKSEKCEKGEFCPLRAISGIDVYPGCQIEITDNGDRDTIMYE